MIKSTNKCLPIFSSTYSVGKSILNLDDTSEIKDNYPVSIFAVADLLELNKIHLVDTTFAGFVKSYKISEKRNKHLCFGLKLTVCENLEDKTEESLKTESKIIVWLLNSEAYKPAVKLYTKASTDGFYYIPRIDWKTLNSMWNENLYASIPFYDSFIHNNSIKNGRCVPILSKIPHNFIIENNTLFFDKIIKNKIETFCAESKAEIILGQSIFYNKKKDFLTYLTMRSIDKGSKLNKPNLSYMGSNEFCVESFLEKYNI